MTAETSNARGEWVLVPREPSAGMWDSAESAMIESECAYNAGDPAARSDAHGFPTMRIWQAVVGYRAMLAAAPPPAAARGDVRGLVSLAKRVQYADTHAQVSKDDAGEFVCLPPWLWLEIRDAAAEALAAEDAEAKTVPVPTRVHLIGETAVIVGTPERGWDEDVQDAHNCDAMGCATIGPHVLARVPFTDERALTAAQQQGQAVAWVSEADIAPFVCAPQMAEFWGTVTLASGPGDGRTVPLYLTTPPSTPVRVSWADFWIAQGDWPTANDYAAFEKAEQWLLAQQPAAVAVDEGSRVVSGQLLHWGGVPVHVTGTVTTSPGNWSLIDAAIDTQPQEPTT